MLRGLDYRPKYQPSTIISPQTKAFGLIMGSPVDTLVLDFYLSLHLCPYFVSASSEGSGKTADAQACLSLHCSIRTVLTARM